MPRSRSRSEPGVLGPLEPKPLEKKYQEPEPLGKKNQEPEPLEKSQEPEPLKKLPAPQPCLRVDKMETRSTKSSRD